MKTLTAMLFSFFVIAACTEVKQKYLFASFVRVNLPEYEYCNGLVRNYLGFGYYQIDNLNCHKNTPEFYRIESIKPKIFKEDEITEYWQKLDNGHYQPAHEYSPIDLLYFRKVDGSWVKSKYVIK